MNGSSKGRYGDYKGTVGQRERFKESRHDSYQIRKKWAEPTRCPGCGAMFEEGRWTWEKAPAGAQEALCPACQRVADHYPAGFIDVEGGFAKEHRDEILHLIRNIEAVEKKEHPLERLMDLAVSEKGIQVTTTGVHLARRIGDALSHAYQGDLQLRYGEAEEHLRVTWKR